MLIDRANLIEMDERAPLRRRVMAAAHEIAVGFQLGDPALRKHAGAGPFAASVLESTANLRNEVARLWSVVIQDPTILEKGDDATDTEVRAAVQAVLFALFPEV